MYIYICSFVLYCQVPFQDLPVMYERTSFPVFLPTDCHVQLLNFCTLYSKKMGSQCSLTFISLLSEVDQLLICLRVILTSSCELYFHMFYLLFLKILMFTPRFKSSLYFGKIRPLSVLDEQHIFFQLFPF